MISRQRIPTDSTAAAIVLVLCASSCAAQSATEPSPTRVFVAAGPIFTAQLDTANCGGADYCGTTANSPWGGAFSAGWDVNARVAIAAEVTRNHPRPHSQRFRTGFRDFYYSETRQRDLAVTIIGRVTVGAGRMSPVIVGGVGGMSRRTVREGFETEQNGQVRIPRSESDRDTVPVLVAGGDVRLYRTRVLTLAAPLRMYFVTDDQAEDLGNTLFRAGITAEISFWSR